MREINAKNVAHGGTEAGGGGRWGGMTVGPPRRQGEMHVQVTLDSDPPNTGAPGDPVKDRWIDWVDSFNYGNQVYTFHSMPPTFPQCPLLSVTTFDERECV
jgi:hypothetical protein